MTEFLTLRKHYHERICCDILGLRSPNNPRVLTIADNGSPASVDLAYEMWGRMGFPLCPNPPSGQGSGARFAHLTLQYLQQAFAQLHHLRPGDWLFSAAQTGIAQFDQYEHLSQLQRVLSVYPDLKAALGGDYIITPDITIARRPVKDVEINANAHLVDDDIARETPLRAANGQKGTLHASISCKWTMRSDRSQNTRTEALNLIRNRKGRTPHIAVVTIEPLPGRLASIAMGTGDVDCTYHAALYELLEAAAASPYSDSADLLATLVSGRRLRDISDLPFDLAS